jgi:hypothetical protein
MLTIENSRLVVRRRTEVEKFEGIAGGFATLMEVVEETVWEE